MAESYEYPPSLSEYRPLHYGRTGCYPATLKFRHHFFLTRAKVVLKEAFLTTKGDQAGAYLQQEIFNVLISQGWCSALGVPVPIPFFLQEILLGSFEDPEKSYQHISSLLKIFLTLEVSNLDQRFHDEIMAGDGYWWRTEGAQPVPFMVLWQRLEERAAVLANVGAFGNTPWHSVTPEQISGILDPSHATDKLASTTEPIPKVDKGKEREENRGSEKDDLVAQIIKVLDLPEVSLSEQDKADLDRIADSTHAELEILRLITIEAETVETEKWNHDAAVQLLNLSQSRKDIPFGKRDEIFDLEPTAHASGPSRKGKERAENNKSRKRSIYHFLPAESKETWLGQAEKAFPPHHPAEKTNFSELINNTLPELFAEDEANHDCVYRNLAIKFVREDVQRLSTERLGEFLTAQNTVIPNSMGSWPVMPPLGDIPSDEADPVADIFQRIAAIAVATVPPPTSSSPPPQSSSENTESDDGSGWESEASVEEEMDRPLDMDVDMGTATFATS